MATRRTSGRARPAKRYTNDAFEGLELDDEAADSEIFAHDDDSGGDDDFDETAAAENEPDVEDDVSEGAASGEDEDGYGEDMLSDDDIVGPETDRPARKPKRKGGKPIKPGFMQRAEASSFKTGSFSLLASRAHEHKESEVKVSSRGVPEMYHNTGKDTRILNLFGPAKEDVVPATTARDRWHDEPVLPSRRVNKRGEGGMAFSPLYTKAVREHEASKGWEWYHEKGGEQAFRTQQEVKVLSEDEAAGYLPQTGKPDQPVLLGPFRNQQLFQMAAGEVINIGQAWSKDADKENGEEAENSSKGAPVRQAWLFNLGCKVQCLEWVPWQEDSQYISTAALQRSKPYRTTENYGAPGFAPTDPTPASIQIWSIQSTDDGRLNYDAAPKLELVLCTDWGSRSRTGSAPLAWHDISQSFLTCDENYTLLALSLRRFHVNMSVGRANSNIQHISASPIHPFTLMGCADGMVIATNPMRKVLIAKAEMWHQTWFLHEWRRAIGKHGTIDEASAGADTRSDLKKPPDNVLKAKPQGELKQAGPMCRVVDGFKAEVYKLWVEQGLPNQYEGVVYNTVYEEETASTQVAWNPNMRCGGWAAAGMGDGLIRIEDLAL
ncbi:hypothetical protein SLS54_004903 [Diplodia seriata]